MYGYTKEGSLVEEDETFFYLHIKKRQFPTQGQRTDELLLFFAVGLY